MNSMNSIKHIVRVVTKILMAKKVIYSWPRCSNWKKFYRTTYTKNPKMIITRATKTQRSALLCLYPRSKTKIIIFFVSLISRHSHAHPKQNINNNKIPLFCQYTYEASQKGKN